MMKKQTNPKFEIDFFLLEMLTEVCWSDSTIVRSSFLQDLVEIHYFKMSENQKKSFWNFLEPMSKRYPAESNMTIGTRLKVLARFCPELQFDVHLDNGTQSETVNAFLYAGKYWTNLNTTCNEEYIKNIIQL